MKIFLVLVLPQVTWCTSTIPPAQNCGKCASSPPPPPQHTHTRGGVGGGGWGWRWGGGGVVEVGWWRWGGGGWGGVGGEMEWTFLDCGRAFPLHEEVLENSLFVSLAFCGAAWNCAVSTGDLPRSRFLSKWSLIVLRTTNTVNV